MALVAKISAKSGKSVRTIVLRKGVNVLAAEADAIVSIIDEATGKAVDAQLVRHGGEVRVLVADSYFSASDSALAAINGAQDSPPAGGTGETPPAEGSTGGEAAGGAGGGSGVLYGLLGALALGGVAAGAGGGGGGDKTPTPPADTTPPAAPTGLALATADDTGASSSDRITSQTSGLTISGTAEANATVTVLNGATTLGTATANASGAFTLDVSLPAGTHNITATARDAAGNTSPASAALAITVDATSAEPTALALSAADDTGPSLSDGITRSTSGLTITGTAEAGATVTLRDGATVLGTAIVAANGNFTLDVSLAEGAHNVTATATDVAGNVSAASAGLIITVDTTVAAPSISPIVDGFNAASATVGTTLTLGARETGVTLTASLSGNAAAGAAALSVPLPVAADGSIALTPAILAQFANGSLTLAATQTDLAGNSATANSFFQLDTAPPTVAVTASATSLLGSQTAQITFTFSEVPSGFSAADVTVTGGALSALTVSAADPRIYTATLTPTRPDLGPIGIAVGMGFIDSAGNAATNGANLSVAFDPGAQGQAIDGYIANALVFRDADGDGAWDHEDFTDANANGLFDAGETYVDANSDGQFTGEFATKTDAEGNFFGLFGAGRIVLTPLTVNGVNVTKDISTGQTFTGKLAAPDGSTVVTPLTTLVEAVAGTGATAEQVAAAQTQVKAALGISASVDITTLDPIAAVASGTGVADAVAVQKAATQVANILAVIGSASEAAGATGGKDAGVAAATAAIAAQIATGASVDLSSSAVIQQVAQSAASSAGGDAGATIAAQATALGDSLANVNNAIAQASGDNAASTLAAVVSAQIVAQETLATEVGAAITNNTVLDSSGYEGAALAEKVDEAATQVEVVVPAPPPPPGAPGTPDRPIIDDGARVSATEAADGVVVTVAFDSAGNIAAGDTLRLLLGDTVVGTIVLTAEDIAARDVTVTLSAAELGADGAKSITAGFVSAAGEGNLSLPVLFTLDTAAPTAPAGLALAAADDSGLAGDRITAHTSALTITGTAEADTTVTLRDGATVLGTATADANGQFTLDVALAAGAHSLTATSLDVAGNVSAASAPLAVTVDTTAPAAPSGIAASEGGLLTGLEAADGTVIAGSTEAGTTVTFTFVNGANTLVKDAQVTGTAFTLTLTKAEIDELGLGAVYYSAVAKDAAGNAGPVSVAGQYVYTNQPIGAANVQVDTPAAPASADEDDTLGVTPLRGGGFAVHWVVDGGEGEDGVAVQRFDADGNRAGEVIVLQGVDEDLVSNESENVAYDLTALKNGGYALTYSLGLGDQGGMITLPGNNPAATIVGRPSGISLGSVPPGVTFTISGLGTDGAQKTVQIPLDQGYFEFDQAFLAQFSGDTRFQVSAVGLATNQSASIFVSVGLESRYDRGGELTLESSTWSVQTNGIGVVFRPGDHNPEAFRIDTRAAEPAFVVLTVTPPPGLAQTLALPAGATLQPNGGIQIVSPAADANGFYRIPESLLAQLEGWDYSANLVIGGQPAGSTVTGSVEMRESVDNPEGVFVQTFDADGNAQGDGGERIDTDAAPFASGEDVSLRVTPLAGGGFAVNWIVDPDGDGDADQLAVQRFTADGAKVGDPVLLTGFSTDVIDLIDDDGSFDLQALEGGGYALAYAQTLDTMGGGITLGAQGGLSALIIGRPAAISVGSLPAGVTLSIVGLGADGAQKTVPIALEDGRFEFGQAFLSQFSPDTRFSLVASGLGNQSVTAFVEVALDGSYTREPAPTNVTTSWTVPANGSGVLFAPGDDHAEAFRIDSSGVTPTAATMVITVPLGILPALALPPAAPGGAVFPDGAYSRIILTNLTPGGDGFYHVPESLLLQLQGLDYSAVLSFGGQPVGSTVTGTVVVRESADNPEGIFVQTFGADGAALGDPTPRLDGGSNVFLADVDDDGGTFITPLIGGGFAVNWLVDFNGDGDPENIAVQRFAADGSKTGDVVVMQGIDDLLEQIDEVNSYDFQVLDNGGYALTYSLALEEAGRSFALGGANGIGAPIVGRPSEIHVFGAPANATFLLFGAGLDGASKSVALVPVNGVITITPEILIQFAVDNRFTLIVPNLGATTAQFYVDAVETLRFDPGAATHDVVRTATVVQQGAGLSISGALRSEAFHLDAISAGTPTAINMMITPAHQGSLNPTGIPNAVMLANGSIQINNIAADANGVYRVPQTILDQLGTHDAQIVLQVNGLPVGSTVTATVTVRDPIPAIEGIFVQTFGPDGTRLSDGVEVVGTAGADHLTGDAGGDVIRGLGGNDVLTGGDGDDVLISGEGSDVMTGGAGDDLFFLDAPAGQTLSLADLIADFQHGTDHIRLPDGVAYADVLVVQGDPGTNGAAVLDSLIVHSASGDILARLANTDAALVTQTSFM